MSIVILKMMSSIEVFKGVIGLDRKLIHCGDYVRLSSEHYNVSLI